MPWVQIFLLDHKSWAPFKWYLVHSLYNKILFTCIVSKAKSFTDVYMLYSQIVIFSLYTLQWSPFEPDMPNCHSLALECVSVNLNNWCLLIISRLDFFFLSRVYFCLEIIATECFSKKSLVNMKIIKTNIIGNNNLSFRFELITAYS
jgi:hypothetical protein